MKKLILTLFLILLLGASAHAAHKYNGSSQSESLADNAALTFPDSDWSLSFWAKFSSYAGSINSKIVSWNGASTGGVNQFTIYVNQSSAAQPNQLNMTNIDSDGTT